MTGIPYATYCRCPLSKIVGDPAMGTRAQTYGQAFGLCADSRFCDLKDTSVGCMQTEYSYTGLDLQNQPGVPTNQVYNFSIPDNSVRHPTDAKSRMDRSCHNDWFPGVFVRVMCARGEQAR